MKTVTPQKQLLLFAIPGEKILESRARAVARGEAAIAHAGAMFCELKGSLTVWEAAQDLACSTSKIREYLQEGKLEAFYISEKDRAERNHVRVLSSSVAQYINANRYGGE